MIRKKKLFIRGNLNDLYDRKMDLKNPYSIDQIKVGYGNIFDGLVIWIWVPAKNKGIYDPTIFPGTIRIRGELIEIEIDESKMVYLSEAKEFKDYNIEDVTGSQLARP